MNWLTVALGLFSGKPAIASAGMLAQAKQEVFINWSRITKINYKPKSWMILLHGAWTENIALFCTPENYKQVESYIRKHLVKTGN